jgi:MFS transporter, DHA2 family, multidrug resistance protein
MSTAALDLNAVSRPAVNPWLVATAVVIPTFMEILDTTIATASMRYIAGGLSATMNDSDWVMTSYLAANATILPITGWLSTHLGRRRYFLLSIAVFTAASVLCGLATSLEQLILFRVIQGIAGGGLQPARQAILIDGFPPEKQGTAMTVFGVAGLIAPVIGPTLGGYITVNYDWRWIFLINLPIGALGYLMCHFAVDDPDYLKKERAELRRRPLNFDFVGLGLLALMMTCWEVLLSKGQEWDWYNDPFGKAQTLAVLFVVCLGALLFRELRIANPVVDFRPLGERNLAASSIIIFCAYGVLYGASVCLPSLLQSLFGYDAFVSGLVMSPSGVFSIVMMLVVGVLLGRGTDARWLIAAGLLVMAAGNYWMARMNLYISPWQVIWPRVVLICGLSLLFAPINVAAFRYTPPTCARPRSACSPCSATRGAAWACRSTRSSSNGASSSTWPAWARISAR